MSSCSKIALQSLPFLYEWSEVQRIECLLYVLSLKYAIRVVKQKFGMRLAACDSGTFIPIM